MNRSFLNDRTFYTEASKGTYQGHTVYFGSGYCVRNTDYGNYVRFSDMPDIISLLSAFRDKEGDSILSIINNIKEIKG